MRLIFTIFILTYISSTVKAQKLTGIWRGYFEQTVNSLPLANQPVDRYKFEVQIKELPNHSIEGVTYSYKTVVFYAKASCKGIYTKKVKTLLLKETGMLEVKIMGFSQPCTMTCYLDYSKTKDKEILSGNYTSQVVQDKSDCGAGTVYLERVHTTEFKKEPFLLKPTAAPKKAISPTPKAKQESSTNQPETVKPGAEGFVLKETPRPRYKPSGKNFEDQPSKSDTSEKPTVNTDTIPPILLERENLLINTIEVTEPDVQVDFYDNGQIDNDTITVYDNNKLIIDHGRLNYSPITIKLHFDKIGATHDVITVANNLGDIPPNTALMVITSGKKRNEVFITSDDKKNARVLFVYKPDGVIKAH